MSSSVSTYQHEWPGWDVYPRIYYFHKRYTDLLIRYKRVTGLLPKFCQDVRTAVVSELDEIRDYFGSGVRLNVIGRGIDIDNLVFSTPEKRITNGSPKAEVFVCHTDIQYLDLEGLEAIHTLAKTLSEEFSQESVDANVTFISCGVENINCYSEEKVDEFKTAVVTSFQDDGRAILRENILVGSDVSCLKSKISDELEKKIMVGFDKINAHLERLDLDDKESSSDGSNILEAETVVNSIYAFLRNPYNFREIHETCVTEKEEESEWFLKQVIFRLARIVKCAAVGLLAKKHNLKVLVCNELLHEIEFEDALCKNISKNVRYHLKKLEVDRPAVKDVRYKFDFLLYPLKEDMTPVFEKTEKKLMAMKRLSMTMRRLLFETNGYLKQSHAGTKNQMQRENHSKKVTESLRRDILKINGVYGLGTVYGKLEIHLDENKTQGTRMETENQHPDNAQDNENGIPGVKSEIANEQGTRMETENTPRDVAQENGIPDVKSEIANEQGTRMETENQPPDDAQENGVPDVKSQIAIQMRKHHFHFPYAVRYVRNKPEAMNGCFEPGNTLHCQTETKGISNKGTVGTFLNSRNGTVYGLTCAHVVSGTKRAFVQKEGRHPFSISYDIVQTGQDECRLIDIAALKVLPCLQEDCKSSLDNNTGRVAKADLETESPQNLIDRYVHKFGAETGLTQGTIMTVDYSRFGPFAEDYIVIVDPLAAKNAKELEDLVGAFSSLLDSSPQDGGEQQNEETDTQMNWNAGASSETNEEKAATDLDIDNRDLDKSYGAEPKRRKLETKETASQPQRTSIVPESGENTTHETQISSDGDTPIAAGARVLCQRNENIESSSLLYVRQPDNINSCTGSMVYVRDITESEFDQCQKDARNVFAEKGDSGSAICTRNLSHDGPAYFAVAMLSAGDFEIDGHSGKKALSFMLKDGLKKLQKHCNLEF